MRPLIGTILESATPRSKDGHYDANRQLTVNDLGVPLLANELSRAQTRTFAERDPSDPSEPRPPKPATVTRVVQEPADVSGFSVGPPQPPRTITKVVQEPADVIRARRRQRRPLVADPWGDTVATGAVDF